MQSRIAQIAIIAALAFGAATAIFAAYGLQVSSRGVSFDSDLAEFMNRSDSSLLEITRLPNSTGEATTHLDEYSIANSNPALYQYFSSVDRAHDKNPKPSAPQDAIIQVVISRSHTRQILTAIDPDALDQDPREDKFDVFAENVELAGRHYSVVILTPR
jgi:hypothetical protein